jgi:hypothetical protein
MSRLWAEDRPPRTSFDVKDAKVSGMLPSIGSFNERKDTLQIEWCRARRVG